MVECGRRFGAVLVLIERQPVAIACPEHAAALGEIRETGRHRDVVVDVDPERAAGWRLVVELGQTRGAWLYPPGVPSP